MAARAPGCGTSASCGFAARVAPRPLGCDDTALYVVAVQRSVPYTSIADRDQGPIQLSERDADFLVVAVRLILHVVQRHRFPKSSDESVSVILAV